MLDIAASAHREGVELIVFPELALSGYLPAEEMPAQADLLNSAHIKKIKQTAKKIGIAIICGFAERDLQRAVVYNSALFIDKQGVNFGLYRKMHLWNTEKRWAQAGNRVGVFSMDKISVASWICYDTRFPEIGRLAALGGAEVAAVPTAWLGPQEEWELAVRARAMDNQIFVAGADIIGDESTAPCRGYSIIVDPCGRILSQAKAGKEGFILADLNTRTLSAQRELVPIFSDRQPDIYTGLIESALR